MPTRPSKSMGGKAVNWSKNFGKSVKFSSIDVLQALAPNMYQTAENAQTATKELTKDIREMKITQTKILKQLETYPIVKAVKDWWKNAKADFASGKFDNRERVERVTKKMADQDMDDFDMGEDFEFNVDDENMEFDPGPEPEGELSIAEDVSAGVEPAVAKVQPGIAATANATRHTAIAAENVAIGQGRQTKAIAEGFHQNTEIAKQIAITTFTLNQRYHDDTLSAFKSINENLGKMVAFNDETVSKLSMGALKYFDDQLEVSNNILAELQKISEKVAPEKPEEEPEEAPQASQLFHSSGVMKFQKYPEILKKNFINAVEQDPILGTLKKVLFDEEYLKMMAANPLSFISTAVVTNLIPTMVKQSMKQLDETVGAFFPALFLKIGKMKDSDNPLKQMLGRIFGLDLDVQTTPQLAQYEKGAVPFDGITHTTINTVIPEYLAGILAAVSGKEQMAFDYDSARFMSKFELTKKLQEEELHTATSSLGKVMGRMKDLTDTLYTFTNDKDRREFMIELEDFFKNLVEQQTIPDFTKEEPSKYGFSSGRHSEIFKQIWSIVEEPLKASVGNGVVKGGLALDSLNKDSKNNKARMANLFQTRTNSNYDEHLVRNNENDETDFEVRNPEHRDWNENTEYGKSQTDLLRDIKGILIEGITVFPKGTTVEGGQSGTIDNTGKTADKRLQAYRKAIEEAEKEKIAHEESLKSKDKDTKTLKEATDDGSIVLNSEYFNGSEEQKKAIVQASANQRDRKTQDANRRKNEMGGFYDQLDKWMNETTFGQKIVDIRKGIDSFFRTPAKFLSDSMDKISHALYTVIYGDDDKKSFIDLAQEQMKETFERFNGWLKKKWNSTTNYLFGEGGLTETKTFKWVKNKSEKLFDLLFGNPDSSGVRKNGAFSEAFNSISDVFLNVRGELFGTPYKDSKGVEHQPNTNSVVHNLKKGISDAFGQMRLYLFGEPKKDKNGNNMSFVDEMTETLGKGFTNWKNFFFGTKTSEEEGKETFKGITEDFKKHLPKALAIGIVGAGVGLVSNFGILGSLFLPGGPVGGAILGTAVGLLGQSEKFKNFLFGPKGVDGLRTGGVISKSVQSWVLKHKVALLGGATFGAVKGIIGSFLPAIGGPLGFMGSFLLPGGPITGALMGAAIGIGWKSKTFQNFLYGKEDKDGKRMGGILNSEMGKGMKKHLPNIAFGSVAGAGLSTLIGQMGFMGAMLTPFGPLGGAILGAATGIAISSDKFRKFLFGEKDEKTGLQKAGLFTKLSNIFGLHAESFKIQMAQYGIEIKRWFKKDIANRFLAALEPFKVQFKLMAKDMREMFAKGWQFLTKSIDGIFERAVGLPLGRFIEDRVLKPMRNLMKSLIGGIGKIFGSIISAPFKAMHMMAGSLMASQQERGLKENREERSNALKLGVKDFGGILGAKFKSMLGLGSQEDKDKAESSSLSDAAKNLFSLAKANVTQYSSTQTSEDKKKYIDADVITAKKEEEDRKADEEYEEAKRKLDIRSKSLEMRYEAASKANFDTVAYDKEGNVVGDLKGIYDMKVPLNQIDLHTQEQTSLLDAIKTKLTNLFQSSEKSNLIAAAMAYHATGNEEFIDIGSEEPGKVADKPIPNSLKDTKIGENAKEKEENEQAIADQNAKDVEEQKKAEEAGTPAGQESEAKPKMRDLVGGGKGFKLTEENILNLISAIPENASEKVKEYYTKVIDRMMSMFTARQSKGVAGAPSAGTSSTTTSSTAPGTVASSTTTQSTTSTSTTGTPATPPAPAPKPTESPLQILTQQMQTNIQLQLEILRQSQQKSKPPVSASDSKEEREFDSKNKVGKRGSVDPSLKYLRIIASNVDGQLNGVGSNVYKSRKLLEAVAGMSSDDITGSNNKDRVTFFGKARRMITMMVFHPLEFIGSVVMKPFQVIADIGKKIWNTAWNIVNGVGTAITKTANAVVEVGKKALDIVLSVPKMAIDIIGGVASVAKETLITGIKVIGEGLTGLLSASFKIINGAAEAMGSAIKGLGKGIGAIFKGVGKLTEGLMTGLGKAIGGVASIIGTFGKTTIEVAGSIAKGLTSIATTAMEGVTKVAGTLVSGVTNLISSAGSAIFSLAASPFKFIGNLGKGLIQRSSHVIVDGGKLDTIKNVEKVEKILVLEKTGREGEETSFWESMKNRFGIGATQSGAAADSGNPQYQVETPGTVSVDQGEETEKPKEKSAEEKPKEEAGKPASEQESGSKESKKEDKTAGTPAESSKKSKSEEKPGNVASSPAPVKETSKNAEAAGKPATSNVTSDMLKSGVVANTGGPVQRTAAMTKAVADANAEKELMKTNELQQTSWLEKLYSKAQERTGMFGKLLKWLASGALLLWGWLGKLKKALTMAGLGKIIKEALEKSLGNSKVETVVSNGFKTALQDVKKHIGEGISRAIGRVNGFGKLIAEGIKKRFGSAIKNISSKFGKMIENIKLRFGGLVEGIAKKLGIETGKDAAKAGATNASKIAIGEAAEGTLKLATNAKQPIALLTAGAESGAEAIASQVDAQAVKAAAKQRAQQMAGKFTMEELAKFSSQDMMSKVFTGTAEENKALYKELAKKFHPDKFARVGGAQAEIAEAAMKNINVAKDALVQGVRPANFGSPTALSVGDATKNMAAEDISKRVSGWLDDLVKEIKHVEKLVCEQTGKNLKFADKLAEVIKKYATPKVLLQHAGKLMRVAASKLVQAAGPVGVVFMGYAAVSAVFDAAHMFRINKESVTMVMRLCAMISKVIFAIPHPYWAILSAILMIICSLMGVDVRGWLAQQLYMILVDSKSAQELEAEQNKFAEEAKAAGFTKTDVFGNVEADVTRYNNKVNATVFQRAWGSVKTGYKDFKDWLAPKVESAKKWVGEKVDYIGEGISSIPEKWKNFKDAAGEKFTAIGETATNAKNSVAETASDAWAWAFGKNDDNGNYVPGFFDDPLGMMADGLKGIAIEALTSDKFSKEQAIELIARASDTSKSENATDARREIVSAMIGFGADKIKSVFTEIADWVGNKVSWIADGVSGLLGDAYDKADEVTGGALTEAGNWVFGYNDDNGNYVPGFFANAKAFITDGAFSIVASALNSTPQELSEGMNKYGPAMFVASKVFGMDVEKLKQGSRIKYIRQTWLNIFGGIDEDTGKEYGGLAEDAKKFAGALSDLFKQAIDADYKTLLMGTEQAPHGIGLFVYPISKVAGEFADWVGEKAGILKEDFGKFTDALGDLVKQAIDADYKTLLMGTEQAPHGIGLFVYPISKKASELGDYLNERIEITKKKWDESAFEPEKWLLGTKEKPMGFGNLVYPIGEALSGFADVIVEGVTAAAKALTDSLGRIPDMMTDTFNGLSTWISEEFRILWGKAIGFISGNDDYNEDVKELIAKHNATYEALDSSMKNASTNVPKYDGNFMGSGNDEYDMTKASTRNLKYGNEPGMGSLGDAGCAVYSVAEATGADVKGLAKLAVSGGYRVNGGTSEDYIPAAAAATGGTAIKVSSIGDMYKAQQAGAEIISGGTSSSNASDKMYTSAGHYEPVHIGADGVTSYGVKGKSVTYDFDKFTNETKTAYAVFKGSGEGDIIDVPDFSSIDIEQGNILKQAGGVIIDWLTNGGFFGSLFRNLGKKIDETIDSGLTRFGNWMFGVDLGEKRQEAEGFIQDTVKTGIYTVLGTLDDAKENATGILDRFKYWSDVEFEKVKNWMFADIPTKLGLIKDSVTAGVDFVFGEEESDGYRRGGVVGKLEQNMITGVDTTTNWMFGNMPEGHLIIDAARSATNFIFGKEESDGIRRGGVFKKLADYIESKLKDVQKWIIGNIPGGSILVDTITKTIPGAVEEFGKNIVKGLSEKWDEFKKKALDFKNIDLKKLFKEGLKAIANKITGNGVGDELFKGSGDADTDDRHNQKSINSINSNIRPMDIKKLQEHKLREQRLTIKYLKGSVNANEGAPIVTQPVIGAGFTKLFKGYGEKDEKQDASSPKPDNNNAPASFENSEPPDPESPKGLPFFAQWDPKWADHEYGAGTMCSSGCGPATLAMVSTWATGKVLMPVEAADWSVAHGYRLAPPNGTSYGLFDAYAKESGFGFTTTQNKEDVWKAIDQGHPVISAQGPGKFTNNGHFIVVAGKRKDDSIIVHDPGGRHRANEKFNKEDIDSTGDNYFIPTGDNIGKNSGGSNNNDTSTQPSDSGSSNVRSSGGSWDKRGISGLLTAFAEGFQGNQEDSDNADSSSDDTTPQQSGGDVFMGDNMTEEQIWDWFRWKGYNANAAAGIMGRLKQEHNFDPKLSEKKIYVDPDYGELGGMGIFQWTWDKPGGGGPDTSLDKDAYFKAGREQHPDSRLAKYLKWADDNSKSYESSASELNYFWDKDSAENNHFADVYCGIPDWTPTTLNKYDYATVVKYWTQGFERGKPSENDAIYAKEFYDKYKDRAIPTQGSSSNGKVNSGGKGKGLADVKGDGFHGTNGPRNSTKGVVIHHIGEQSDIDRGVDDINKYFHNGKDDKTPVVVGYNFVIRKNGEIERGRKEDEAGGHARHDSGKPSDFDNWNSLGVNVSGTFMGSAHPTQSQLDSASHLIADLAVKYNFPVDSTHIIPHNQTSNTDCPGPNLEAKIPDIISTAKGMIGSGKGDKFTGAGHVMHIDPQTGKECTISATKLMYRAYKGEDINPTFDGPDGWANYMDTLPSKETNFSNSSDDKTKFETLVGDWFTKKPTNPLFLYQTGGDGRRGSHPLNRGSGDHAVVIGRKTDKGVYEIYDSNGGIVHSLNLEQIFDSTAKGGTAQSGMPAGTGNTLWVPTIDPTEPITEWQTAEKSANTDNKSPDASDSSKLLSSNKGGKSVNNKPTTMLGLLNKYLHELGVAVRKSIDGQVYTEADWLAADTGGRSSSTDSSSPSTDKSSDKKTDTTNTNGTAPEKDVTGLFLGKVAMKEAELLKNKHPELMWAQMMLETGGPDNKDYWGWKAHNYGGIKYYPSQMDTSHDSGVLSSEGDTNYAKFKDDDEFAQMWYKYVLRHYPGVDTASTALEWGKALHPNDGGGNYSGQTAETYAAGIQAWLDKEKDKIKNFKGSGFGNKFIGAGDATGKDLTIIGDSILDGSKYQVQSLLTDAKIDSRPSRTVREGVDVAKRLKQEGQFRDRVVVELGTNGGVGDFRKDDAWAATEDMLKLLEGKKQAYWMTTFNPSDSDEVIQANNDYIKKLATSHKIKTIDWYAIASKHPEWFSGKDCHPVGGRGGNEAFAKLIHDSVTGEGSVDTGGSDTDNDTNNSGSDNASDTGKTVVAKKQPPKTMVGLFNKYLHELGVATRKSLLGQVYTEADWLAADGGERSSSSDSSPSTDKSSDISKSVSDQAVGDASDVHLKDTGNIADDAGTFMSNYAKAKYGADVPSWFWRTIIRAESSAGQSYFAKNDHNWAGFGYESWMGDELGAKESSELADNGQPVASFKDDETGFKGLVEWFFNPKKGYFHQEYMDEIKAAQEGDWEKAFGLHELHYRIGCKDWEEANKLGFTKEQWMASDYYSIGKQEFGRGDIRTDKAKGSGKGDLFTGAGFIDRIINSAKFKGSGFNWKKFGRGLLGGLIVGIISNRQRKLVEREKRRQEELKRREQAGKPANVNTGETRLERYKTLLAELKDNSSGEEIKKVCDEIGIEFDGFGNVKGINIPEEFKITDKDNDIDKYAKQLKQIKGYFDYGGKLTEIISKSEALEKYGLNKLQGGNISQEDIDATVKNLKLDFDEFNNVKGINIPEELKISSYEDKDMYTKQLKQIQGYFDYGGKTPDGKIVGDVEEPTEEVVTGKESVELSKKDEGPKLSLLERLFGRYWNRKSGKTKKGYGDILGYGKGDKFIGSGIKSTIAKYAMKTLMGNAAANEMLERMDEKLNDFPRLKKVLEAASYFDPISILTLPYYKARELDSKIASGEINPNNIDFSNEQYYGNGTGDSKKPKKGTYEYYMDKASRAGGPGLFKHSKDYWLRKAEEVKPKEELKPEAIADTYVNGMKQASITTFRGGEYYNDVTKVCPEIKAYITGKGDIASVFKAIGFDKIPSTDTLLTVEQQQKLGFREFSRSRTVQHFLVDVDFWKDGKTPVEVWCETQKLDNTPPPQLVSENEKPKTEEKPGAPASQPTKTKTTKPKKGTYEYYMDKASRAGGPGLFKHSKDYWLRKAEEVKPKEIKDDEAGKLASSSDAAIKAEILSRYGIDKLTEKATKEDIDAVVKNLNIDFDELQNVKGIKIPDELKITDFNDPDKYKKQFKQLQLYFDLGGKNPDGKTLDELIKEKKKTQEKSGQPAKVESSKPKEKPKPIAEPKKEVKPPYIKIYKPKTQDKPGTVVETPQFATKEDILKRYGLDKLKGDTATKEDIDAVVKNLNIDFDELQNVKGIKIPDELKITDFNDPDKYKKQYLQIQKYFELGGKTPEGKTLEDLMKEPLKQSERPDKPISGNASRIGEKPGQPAESQDGKPKKFKKGTYEYYMDKASKAPEKGDFFHHSRSYWLKKAEEVKPNDVAPPKRIVDLTSPTVVKGVTQASISTFQGGEYFNDIDKVTDEAKAYVRGEGSLEDVAKSIGFDKIPSDDTPLTVEQQQMLGFREYNPIRTWAHYTTDSSIWSSGNEPMTSVERWMKYEHGLDITKPQHQVPLTPETSPVSKSTDIKPPTIETRVNEESKTGSVLKEIKELTEKKEETQNQQMWNRMVELLQAIANNTSGIDKGFESLSQAGRDTNAIIFERGGSTKNPNDYPRQPYLGRQRWDNDRLSDETYRTMTSLESSPEHKLQSKIAAGGEFKRRAG